MSKCKLCNIEILDDTERCPLCHHVIELKKEDRHIASYPDAREIGKKHRMLKNIFLYCSIVVWVILFVIDYSVGTEFMWSFPIGLGIIYANILLRMTILGKSPYTARIVWTILIALACLIETDILTGNNGWALNYAFPSAIILLNIGVIILMLFINRKNWQSYLMVQLVTLPLCLLLAILIWVGVITSVVYSCIACLVSVFLFLGIMIIGDQRAREELRRRFHF